MRSERPSRRWHERPLTVLALLALWLVATLGVRPLMMPDEGRYGDVARQMLAGDAWVPRLGGLPFFHKPPLFYWIDALALRLTGVEAAGARAGALLGAWLMGASLYLFARRRWGTRRATLALLVLATSPLYFVSAQYANHDMLVAGCIGAALLAFLRALESDDRVSLRWLVLAWVACGAGMLAKGLIGFVLPALVLGPWLLATGRWRRILSLLHPLAVAAGVAVAAPWFVAMQSRFPGFFDYLFMEQHVRRFAAAGFNNVQPWWFFVLLLPLLTLPWSLGLPGTWRVARLRPPWPWLWWVLSIVLFFSLPRSKLVGYVLPVLPAWSLLLARGLQDLPPRRLGWMLLVAVLACLGSVEGLARHTPTAARDLGRALGNRLGSADQVVLVDAPLHDLSFYADLQKPAIVLSDWDSPKAREADGWRKELSDAARFDPAAGARLLRPLSADPGLPCGTGSLWFVVPAARQVWIAARPQAQAVMERPGLALWREPMQTCAAPAR